MSFILLSALTPVLTRHIPEGPKVSLPPSFPPSLLPSFLDLWTHTGWNKRIEYEPGTGSLALFPNVHLETCDEPVASVQATVELETGHIGKGCDRDTYSEQSLHRLCGKGAWWSSVRARDTLSDGRECVCWRGRGGGLFITLNRNRLFLTRLLLPWLIVMLDGLQEVHKPLTACSECYMRVHFRSR